MVSLVHISYLDSLADIKRTGVRGLLTHDETEEGGFAGTVRTDDTYYTALRKREREILEKLLLAERL